MLLGATPRLVSKVEDFPHPFPLLLTIPIQEGMSARRKKGQGKGNERGKAMRGKAMKEGQRQLKRERRERKGVPRS